MKKQTTRRALLMSALSLLLCFSMLIGSTFALFTDSVESKNNIIKSGKLDVELYYQVEGQSDWTKVTDTTNVFMEGALWEPGHTEVVKLKVVNEGTLALKYQLGINVASEVGSVNVDGEDFKLSDFIKFGVVDGAMTYTRDEAIAAVDATATKLNVPYNTAVGKLYSADENAADATKPVETVVTMVVYMPTTVGNEANYGKNEAVPTINLGLNLFASQLTHESDSFNDQYDKFSEVFTVAEANEAIAAGENATLVNCIDAAGVLEVPAGYEGTLTVVNSTVKSIRGAGDVNLVILGDVVVNAKGTGSDVMLLAAEENGSAVAAKGKLSVTGTGSLTAIAEDKVGSFGIGGMETTAISLKGITVNNTTVNGYEINNKGINTGTTLWANKNSMKPEKLTVTVDGVQVY